MTHSDSEHRSGSGGMTLEPAQWKKAQRVHAERVDARTRAHLERRSRGEKHPVWDFLFDYYAFRPAQLRRWHPGIGVRLHDPDHEAEQATWKNYRRSGEGGDFVEVDSAAFLSHRASTVEFVRALLEAEPRNPTHFDCFGLHEWAMVYETDRPRHNLPLRLGAEGTNDVVRHHPLRCTHIDAFRFFTPAAQPLNATQLTRADQLSCDNVGCLHATMDLYKWAGKLLPIVSSELWLAAFDLACQARKLDMEASPYDCRELGEPGEFGVVFIETPEGKAEYVRRQRGIAEASRPIRQGISEYLQQLL